MESGNQQRILGYFIEEAKEHLDTIEKGLLNLRSVVDEPEMLDEMFRAAHSVKGGGAMLGFSSIQKTAHRLEDAFKVLKDSKITVDQKLENLFLQGYDTLRDLIDKLQGPFGLREEDAARALQTAEPNFAQLQSYLDHLASGGKPPTQVSTPPAAAKVASTQSTTSAKFGSQVTEILRQMLQLFKQQDTPQSRQNLQKYCKRLAQVGAGNQPWKELVTVSYRAIANRQNSYQSLAPSVIKELKQASDQMLKGNSSAIAPSPTLRQLAGTRSTGSASATDASPKQITITLEPKAAAKALVKAFNKRELSYLVKLLANVVRTSS
ncbi:MAG: Hpt domain-containing protein [Coleofasciculaceae cyanobacterium]